MSAALPPLPPLPHITEDPFRHYTAAQMQTYASQARADLEAEVKRLREALLYAVKQVPELGTVPGIAAALKEQP